MRRFLPATAFAVVSLVLAACATGPQEVRASSYEQGCTESADCVLVRELEVSDDSKCFMGCGGEGVINKRVEAEYERDLAANAKECEGMPGLDCGPSKVVAECVRGKCAGVTKP